MSSSAQIRKSSLWLTLNFALVRGMQLVAQIVLARLLTRGDFGIWSMVLIVTTLSALFKDSVLASVLIQRGLEDKKLVNAVYSLTVNISIGMFILQAAAGYPLSRYFEEPILFPLVIGVAFVFLISAGAGSHAAVLSVNMKFRELAITDTVAGFMRTSITIAGALMGYGVWAFVAGEISSSFVASAMKRWWSGYSFRYHLFPDKSAVAAVRGYISSLIGINLAVYANTNSDNLIIGKLLGPTALGTYNLAYQLAMLPNFALSQINRVNFTVLAQRNPDGQQAYLGRLLKLYAFSAAPIYGVAFVVAPWLIPKVYGMKWGDAVFPFQVILIFAYARGFMAILGTTLNALNKPHLNALINWLLVPLSIPTFILGAQLGGIRGVAIAVASLLGIGATLWFWVATCWAGKWPLLQLLKQVWLPTVLVTILVAIDYVWQGSIFWQAAFIVLFYGCFLALLYPNHASQMLMKLNKRLSFGRFSP
jgi:lipopolysaccharide exporter